jgi:ketosteroid isomerase-like protein
MTKPMSEDEAAIRNLVDTWMAASKAGDTGKCLDGYAGLIQPRPSTLAAAH